MKDWDYDSLRGRLDPPNWYKNYPTCNGKRQSPISIECSDVVHDKTLKPLEFINYNKTLEDLVLFNDGFTGKQGLIFVLICNHILLLRTIRDTVVLIDL